MILSQKKIEDFKSQGYLVLDDIFSKDELESFASAVFFVAKNELERANIPFLEDAKIVKNDIIKLNELGLMDRYSEIISYLSEVARFHSHPVLRSCINQVLGRNKMAPLFLTNNNAIMTLPQDPDYTYTWHKDTFYTIPQSRYVQIWAPLIQPSSVQNGTLRICPESHLHGHKGQIKLNNVPNRHKYIVGQSEVDKYSQMNVEMKLGSVLIFDQGLIHRSGENNSGQVRYSLVGVYHDTDFKDFHPVGRQVIWRNKTPDDYFGELSQSKEL